MRCLGLKFDPRQIERLILEFDENGSGGVELDEFERIIRNLVRIRNYLGIDRQSMRTSNGFGFGKWD